MSHPTHPSPTRVRPWRSPPPDAILGLALIAVALGFLAYTLGLSGEAAAWPRGVLLLLLALAAAITVRGFRAPPARPKEATGADAVPDQGDASTRTAGADSASTASGGDSEPGEWSRRILRRPALTLAIVAGYVALLEVVGFLPATGVYLLGHLWFGGVRDWRILSGVVVGVLAFIQLLFVYQLSVPLPTGLLFE